MRILSIIPTDRLDRDMYLVLEISAAAPPRGRRMKTGQTTEH
jgi:hypothetical protein